MWICCASGYFSGRSQMHSNQLTRRCSRPAAGDAPGLLAQPCAAGLLSGRVVRKRVLSQRRSEARSNTARTRSLRLARQARPGRSHRLQPVGAAYLHGGHLTTGGCGASGTIPNLLLQRAGPAALALRARRPAAEQQHVRPAWRSAR